MTTDGDLVDDNVPPDEDDAPSDGGPDDTSPVTASPDDAPGEDQPAAAPRPDADRPTILRNLRAFDRRDDPEPDEDEDEIEAEVGVGVGDGVPDGTAPDDLPPDGWSDDVTADGRGFDGYTPEPAPPMADAPTTVIADPFPTAPEPEPSPAPPVTDQAGNVLTPLALDADPGTGAEAEPDAKERSPLRSLVEWVVVIVGALVVATIIKTFLFQAFWIPSDSMLPTLHRKDRVLVNKLSYDLHDVHRGDVVVFERPPGETAAIKDLIKRVVAVEGDTLTLENGKVLVNGEAIDEPYLSAGTETVNICAFTGTVKIPEGHVFVMGDNRENSKDSRCFGPIDEDLIVGRAFVKVWPVGDLGTL